MKGQETPVSNTTQSTPMSVFKQPQQVIEDMLRHLHHPEVREALLPEIRELCVYERTIANDNSYKYIILTNEDRDNILALHQAYDDVLEETKPFINRCNDLLGFGEGRRKNISELEEHFYHDQSNSEALNEFTEAMSRIKTAETALDDLLLSQRICERFVTNYIQVAHLLNRTGWENTWINNIYSIIPASSPLESTPQQATRPTTAQSEDSLTSSDDSLASSASRINLSSLLSTVGFSTPTQSNTLSSSYSNPMTPPSTPSVSLPQAAANRFIQEAARTAQETGKEI